MWWICVSSFSNLKSSSSSWYGYKWQYIQGYINSRFLFLSLLSISMVLRMTNRYLSLQWRYNDHDSVSNHQPHGCLLNRLFRRRSKKTYIKAPRHWPLCGEFTGEFPARMASYAENVSIWWRHHVFCSAENILWRLTYGIASPSHLIPTCWFLQAKLQSNFTM